MALLPHGGDAILDLRKIEDYCLNPAHPRGRHKARVFREALGLERQDSPWLREELLERARTSEATELASDRFGARWRIDAIVARGTRAVVVRTIWMVSSGEHRARFVTCWVL